MNWIAGLDIGGTNLKAVAVTANGDVVQRLARPTGDGGGRQVDWATEVRAALRELESATGSTASAAGVCAPGLAARDGRSIAHLPGKLAGLAGIDWTRALARFDFVPVLNDAQAALLGEAWTGAARGRQFVVLLTLGTGVGGAVLNEGKLLRGVMNRAGHIGHMSLDPEGAPSITGMPGALEVFAGDCTIATRSGGRFHDTAELVAAYRRGDADATRVWHQTVRALGTGIGACINLFDPELVVIGGGIAQAGDALFPLLARELDRVEWRPGGHRVSIVPAELGEWAGAIGAAAEAIRASGTRAG